MIQQDARPGKRQARRLEYAIVNGWEPPERLSTTIAVTSVLQWMAGDRTTASLRVVLGMSHSAKAPAPEVP